MKKAIILLIAITLTFIVGCEYTRSDNLTKTDASFEIGNLKYGMEEWTSPDGVHYWIYTYGYKFGIAPRYDSNGNLVIDDIKENKLGSSQ